MPLSNYDEIIATLKKNPDIAYTTNHIILVMMGAKVLAITGDFENYTKDDFNKKIQEAATAYIKKHS